jgi:hypothetical protein
VIAVIARDRVIVSGFNSQRALGFSPWSFSLAFNSCFFLSPEMLLFHLMPAEINT